MKKLLILAFAAVQMFAAGTVTQTITQIGATGTFAMEWRWTGDASTGSVPVSTAASLRSQQFQGMLLVGAEFIPGSTAPTTLYDVTITDDGGYDILAGAGANLSATAASTALVSASATPLNGALTMTLTNNSVASATGRVVLYMQRQNTATINGFYGGIPLAKLSTAGATVGDAIVLGSNGRWGPGAGGGGGSVSSVFGRTGAVTATGGDYTASQVTNVPAGGIAATDVQAAITELDTEKQASGNYITALTGDATASGPGSAALTLATVNSNTGACGDSTHVCQVTLNAKGLATAAAAVAISSNTGNAASAVTTTCSGASATFTATSNTINRFDCTLVATNVTSSALASLTSGGLYTLVITQPVGGGITFAATTGLTGFLPITTGLGDAANEVCTVEFVATSTTTGRVTAQNCTGGTPGLTFSNSTSGTTSIQGPATGTNVSTAPGGAQTLLGHNATNTFGTSGTLDMSAVTNDEAFRLPNVAGAANTTEGACSYDTTNDNVHCGENGVDTILPSVLVSAPLVNGNCVQASVTSSRVRLSDAGAACGGGSSSYFPQYSCIDNSTGWSDYNYGTQMTITVLQNTAGSNCGIWAQQEGSDYVRARVKSTGSSTFNAKYALRIGTMIGDGAEAGVLVKDSGTQSVVCGLRFSAGSQRFLWQGDRYTTTSATSAAETINSAWTAGSAQYALAYNTGAGNPGAYFTGQALLYIELASTNGTTTTCRASFDGVIWIPVWSSTFLTPDSTGYYTRSGFSTTDNLYVLGTN